MKMRTQYWIIGAVTGFAALSYSGDAEAELAHVLNTIPRPHARIMLDTSVTMDISLNCSGCHQPTRLTTAKQALSATLPLIQDYFVFSAARYAGCGAASIRQEVPPDFDTPNDDPASSYAATNALIAGARACGSKERRLGNGNSVGILTPGNVGASAIVTSLAQGAVAGFDPLSPFRHHNCTYQAAADFSPCMHTVPPPPPNGPPCLTCLPPGTYPTDGISFNGECYHVGCDDPFTDSNGDGFGGDPVSPLILASFIGLVQTINWPHFVNNPIDLNAGVVNGQFCQPVAQALQGLYSTIAACPFSSNYLDGPPLQPSDTWCDSNTMASSICAPASPLAATCVCDDSDLGCLGPNAGATSCSGNALGWKARQQVAVCNTYDPAGVYQDLLRPDNAVMGGCRENHALFLTDGYMGHRFGVGVEAANAHTNPFAAPNPVYRSPATGLSNMAVFHLSNQFTGQANAMMNYVSDGQFNTRFSATNVGNMQASFSRVLNRAYKGVYRGSGLGIDDRGTRVALHSFTVPGYNTTGPSEDYLGWPARISWHDVDATNGTINPAPVFQTDAAGLYNSTVPGCGRRRIVGMNPVGSDNSFNVAQLGPGGAFANNVNRTVLGLTTSDRDGDGVDDNHPAVSYGRMYSMGATKPVVVEGALEIVNGTNKAGLITHIAAIQQRHRMIYSWGNGQLLSFFGGQWSNAPETVGYVQYPFSYTDNQPYAGAEVLRYEPSWINLTPNFTSNNLIQQPLTNGELTVREAPLRTGPNPTDITWATLLVGAQGAGGRGMFSMDITDPCNPQMLGEWTLDAQATASAEPAIYLFPTTIGVQTAVVMTGGLGTTANPGPPTLYAFDYRGNEIDRKQLPADIYPSAPVCVDATGEGNVSHCYLLASSGRVVRVKTDSANGGFDPQPAYDLTPAGVMGGNRLFYASPAVFFGPDNSPNIVFGSGDIRTLDRDDGVQNYVYKVVDRDVNTANPGAANADLATACGAGPRINGTFPLGAGERMIAAPIIEKGVVAWTTYSPGVNGCIAGGAYLYAINFQTCSDANTGAANPAPVPIGSGLPSSPTLHRASQSLIAGTSAGPTAAQTAGLTVDTRGANLFQATKRFWRPFMDTR